MTQDKELHQWCESRRKTMEEERAQREAVWKDCYRFAAPGYQVFLSDGEDWRKTRRIWDGRAPRSRNLWTRGIFGYMITQGSPWLSLKSSEAKMASRAVKAWLEFAERALYAAFANSDFYQQALMAVDGASILGHTLTEVINDPASPRAPGYQTVQGDTFWIDDDERGVVDTYLRRFSYTTREMYELFGQDAKDLYPDLEDQLSRGTSTKYVVYRMLAPNAKYIPGVAGIKNKKTVVIYWTDKGLLKQSGIDRRGVATWRTARTPQSPYCIGITEAGLSDIKVANGLSRDMLARSGFAAKPMLDVPDERADTYVVEPGAVNRYLDPQRRAIPLQMGGEYSLALEQLREIYGRIDETYQAEFFLLLSSSLGQARTATEVREIMGEKAVVMAPLTGGLASEYISAIVRETLAVEIDTKRIPAPPPDLMMDDYEGGYRLDVDIEYLGVLPTIQRRYITSAGLLLGLNQALPIMQVQPSVADIPDWDWIFRRLMTSGGAPVDSMKDDDLVAMIRKQRADMQAAEQQMAAGNLQADTLAKTAQAAGGDIGKLAALVGGG